MIGNIHVYSYVPQRVMWTFTITWHPLLVHQFVCKLFTFWLSITLQPNFSARKFVRFSTTILHFVLICQKHEHFFFLFFVETWKMFCFEITMLSYLLVDANNVCEIYLKNSSFTPDPAKNLTVMQNSCFWLPETLKMYSLWKSKSSGFVSK